MPDSRSQLEALSRAVLAVTQHLAVPDLLQMIVESGRELLDAEYAALGIPDETGRFAEFHQVGVPDEQWEAIGPLPRSHGMLGVMMREAYPQRLADIRADPRFAGWPEAHPELRDFLGMPIVDGEEILGALYLANKKGGNGFTAADQQLLGVLAAHAAIALTNARLYERSRELALVEERNRLARELHDAVAQKLFSLRLTAEAAAALYGDSGGRCGWELAQVRRLAGEALDELRAVVDELRPPELTEDGLVPALRKHLETLRRSYPADVVFTAGEVPVLPAPAEDVVFRVAQEAVYNAVRHASPSRIDVELRGAEGRLVLEVRDDGTGFDATDDAPPGTRHLGLESMRDRAKSVRGRFAAESGPGKGTTVRLEVPAGGARAGCDADRGTP